MILNFRLKENNPSGFMGSLTKPALCRHSGRAGGSAREPESTPLCFSPLAKGEIKWGFWIPAFAGMTKSGRRFFQSIIGT
jgi:hypothetical protein